MGGRALAPRQHHSGRSADAGALLWYRAVSAHLFRRGNLAELPAHLSRAREVFPQSPDLLFDSGYLHQALSSPAIQASVQQLRANDVTVAVGSRSAELQRAERFFREGLALAPNDGDARIRLGHTLGELGKHQEAAAELRRAIDAKPDKPRLYLAELFLARQEEVLGRRDESLRRYERAADLYPAAQSPRFGMSGLARQTGDRASAQRSLRELTSTSHADRADPWWLFYETHLEDADVLMDATCGRLEGDSVSKALIVSIVISFSAASSAIAQSANEALFEAARAGDVRAIEAALAAGANVNATSRYDVTPLIFAASNGRLEAVKLLVAQGANVNAQDSFYRSSAAGMAIGNGHVDVAVFLLQNGWEGGADFLTLFGVQSDNAALVKTALASKVTRQGLQSALGAAERMKRAALIPILKAALDALPAEPAAPAFVVDPATLGRYAGTYRAGTAGMTMTVVVQEGTLTAQVPGQPAFRLTPSAAGVFRVPEVGATLTFTERGGLAESIQLVQGPATIVLARDHA